MGRRREIEIEIAVGRSFLLILLVAVVLVALVGASQADTYPTPPAAPLQRPLVPTSFYVTPGKIYQGDEALTACAPGYHMASLGEISEVSNLTYDTVRGYAAIDAAEGPPSAVTGWVRTGYHTAEVTTTPGIATCLAWTSNSSTDHGTVVMLAWDWMQQGIAVSPWEPINDTGWTACDAVNRVWCVRPVQVVFLPLVLRSY